jgi:glyoxylase-like metal-dependent hydrolase (beta-lactamase superfamily II)
MPAAQYGTASVHRVADLDPFAIPLDFIFPGATIPALALHKDALAHAHVDFDNATVLLAIQSHLIRFCGKTILLDACVGGHKGRPLRPEWKERADTSYIANLAIAGCTPDDIDIAMCTHLHADHVGWNTRLESGRWVPTFAKAGYLMSQVEVDHRAKEVAQNPEVNHSSYQDSVLPVLERGLVTLVQPGDEIVGGGTITALPGHAPGQVGLEIAAGQAFAVLWRCYSQPGAGLQSGLVERVLPRSRAGGRDTPRAPRTRSGGKHAPASRPSARRMHAGPCHQHRTQPRFRALISRSVQRRAATESSTSA